MGFRLRVWNNKLISMGVRNIITQYGTYKFVLTPETEPLIKMLQRYQIAVVNNMR